VTALCVALTVPAAAPAAHGRVGPTGAPRASDSAPIEKFNPRSRGRSWTRDEVLVGFQEGIVPRRAKELHARLGADVKDRLGGGVQLVRLPPGLSVERAVAVYQRDPRVAVAEPNLFLDYQIHAPLVPSDPRFGQLWGLSNSGQAHPVSRFFRRAPAPASGTPGADIDAPEAWQGTLQGEGAVVAIADSGVGPHPDLDGQLWTNPDEIADNGLDDDGNGCIDDIHGCNFAATPPNGRTLGDAVPHGTHVAGTIAAGADNGLGVAGVCPHCQIMVLKLGKQLTLAAELNAFTYARRMGVRIINASFGSEVWSGLERNAIAALGRDDVILVAAAGNAAADNDMGTTVSPLFPASYTLPNIVSIAATNHHDRYGYSTDCDRELARWRCAFSNFGRFSVDVAAPGTDVVSTVPDGGFATFDGTSMAAPHVSGVAGLLLADHPDWGYAEIKNAIMNSADRPSSLKSAWSPLFRGSFSGAFSQANGRVDALAALSASTANATLSPGDGSLVGATSIRRSRRGRVSYPGDINDVYRKRLVKGRRYEVKLFVPRGKDYDLWVWKPAAKEIYQFQAGCFGGPGGCQLQGFSANGSGRDEVIRFRASRSGVHYLHVMAWARHRGAYRVVVRRI
jgi:subtilisin family serine protease